jgi:hypothetical protein
MYTYEVIENIIKRTDEVGNVTWIPTDSANADYQEYLNPKTDNEAATL